MKEFDPQNPDKLNATGWGVKKVTGFGYAWIFIGAFLVGVLVAVIF